MSVSFSSGRENIIGILVWEADGLTKEFEWVGNQKSSGGSAAFFDSHIDFKILSLNVVHINELVSKQLQLRVLR